MCVLDHLEQLSKYLSNDENRIQIKTWHKIAFAVACVVLIVVIFALAIVFGRPSHELVVLNT